MGTKVEGVAEAVWQAGFLTALKTGKFLFLMFNFISQAVLIIEREQMPL